MFRIKLIGFNTMLLENPPSSVLAFVKEKNIFYKKDEKGILFDNYRVMKFFLTREMLLKKQEIKTIDDNLLWDITAEEDYKKIWTAVEKPILLNFREDFEAHKKLIRLYFSQPIKNKKFEKSRQKGVHLYKIDCFGNILEYKIIKTMNTMYEIKCLNKEKKNQRLHYKREEFWYTKKGVLKEAESRLKKLEMEIKELKEVSQN